MYGEHPTPYEGLAGRISSSRVRLVFRLAGIVAEDRVLEVGCESGKLLVRAPSGAYCVGTDISSAALSDARRLFASQGRRGAFVLADAQMNLPFRESSFDVILCSEMLEHVPEPVAALRNIRKVAGANGRIVVSVPIERPKVALKHALKRLRVLDRIAPGLESSQSEWHLHAFSLRLLRTLAGDAGLKISRKRNVWGFHWVVELRPI
jgi:ubiquinone/menaquinone biosynthesis C-methylase UbiE